MTQPPIALFATGRQYNGGYFRAAPRKTSLLLSLFTDCHQLNRKTEKTLAIT